MRFTDPNLFVHVRFDRAKNKIGSSLRIYEVAQANSNVKITALQSLGKVKGPREELIFADGSRVYGANYQKLVDFLKEWDLYVNCLGRILVTSALRKDPPPPASQAPALYCLRVFDYFPWHEYGGPNLSFDGSWVALDLKQNKIAGQEDTTRLTKENADLKKKYDESKLKEADAKDKEKKLRDKFDELQKKFDDLKKKYEEKEKEVSPFPQIPAGYEPIENFGIENTEIWTINFTRVDFTTQQYASRDYGFSTGMDQRLGSFRSERSGVWIHVVAYVGSTRVHLATMTRELRNGRGRCFVSFIYNISQPQWLAVKFVNRSMWKHIGRHGDWFEAKPGSIWYG